MAEKRKITGKVKITKKVILTKAVAMPVGPLRREASRQDGKTSEEKAPQKRGCNFCQSKISPAYTDVATLKRYVSDRGKIVPKARSGVCSKHQRQVTKGIKHARHLALLPFTQKV